MLGDISLKSADVIVGGGLPLMSSRLGYRRHNIIQVTEKPLVKEKRRCSDG